MKLDPVLQKAARLARSGKYDEVVKTLELEVNRYNGSFRYYYLLGASCLHVGDFGGALTYFRLAREVKMREPLAMLGLAVLYLRRGETDRAVDIYLDVQEMEPKNKTAARALKVIRKYSGPDAFSAWLDSGRLHTLFPPIPFAGFSPRRVLLAAGIFAIVLAACLFALVNLKIITNPLKKPGSRQLTAELDLSQEERREPVQTGGIYRYIVTRTEALDTYDRALSLFTAYRDEAAKIQLNRILESNAAETIQNKAKILLSYMETPGFDNFRHSDNVSYTEVLQNTPLYRDVHIIWRGMATNVENAGVGTSFDFLVGYDTRQTLEGIVPVVFKQAVSINTSRPLEVLGKIVLTSGSSAHDSIVIEGMAIHQSGKLVSE